LGDSGVSSRVVTAGLGSDPYISGVALEFERMRTWWAETVGGLPRTFWYLWVGTLINRAGGFVVIYLAVYLTVVRDFPAGFVGMVVGLHGAGGAVGAVIGGVLADRWGRRPTLLLGHFGASAAALSLGMVSGPIAIALLTVAFGVCMGMSRPAFNATVIDVVPEDDRLRALTLNYWAVNLGFSAAALIAGFLATVDYLLLFVLEAASTFLAGLLLAVTVRESRPVIATAPSTREGGKRERVGLGTVLADRIFLIFVALNLFAWMIIEMVPLMPLAMQRDGLPTSAYGTVIAVNGVLIVAGQLFVPRLIARRSRTRVLALAAVLLGTGVGMITVADSVVFYAVTVMIWTLGEMLVVPTNSALIADLSPTDLRGRYQGVLTLSFTSASFLSPFVGGLVLQHFGEATLWLGCLTLGLLVAGAQLVTGPARERRVAELRAAAQSESTGQASAAA